MRISIAEWAINRFLVIEFNVECSCSDSFELLYQCHNGRQAPDFIPGQSTAANLKGTCPTGNSDFIEY